MSKQQDHKSPKQLVEGWQMRENGRSTEEIQKFFDDETVTSTYSRLGTLDEYIRRDGGGRERARQNFVQAAETIRNIIKGKTRQVMTDTQDPEKALKQFLGVLSKHAKKSVREEYEGRIAELKNERDDLNTYARELEAQLKEESKKRVKLEKEKGGMFQKIWANA